MIVRVSEKCVGNCGSEVVGEIDTESREFIHRFRLPRGADQLLPSTRTEVDGVRLVTFGPPPAPWSVDCPVCRARIPIPAPAPSTTEGA